MRACSSLCLVCLSRSLSLFLHVGMFVLLCFVFFFVFLPEFCEVVAGVYSNENACISFAPLFSH